MAFLVPTQLMVAWFAGQPYGRWRLHPIGVPSPATAYVALAVLTLLLVICLGRVAAYNRRSPVWGTFDLVGPVGVVVVALLPSRRQTGGGPIVNVR